MPGISLFGNCSRNLGSLWAVEAGHLKARTVEAAGTEVVVAPPASADQKFVIVEGIAGRLVGIVMVFQKD